MAEKSIFTVGSDAAYEALRVKKAGQKWFAFDGTMDDARAGRVSRFVMAVWNYHADEEGVAFGQWAIVLDRSSNTYWYKVAREKQGQDPGNRKALWNALLIAHRDRLQMHAVLKDRKTKRCSLEHVFAIQNVLMDAEGSALWLLLDASRPTIGTPVREESLPALSEVPEGGGTSNARSSRLTFEQYGTACRWAQKVYEEEVSRGEALDALQVSVGLNRNSAAALVNNYRCMVDGQTFKAPMSAEALEYFVDEIIAKHGADAGDQVVTAVEGYLAYAYPQREEGRGAIRLIVDRLREEMGAERLLKLLQAEKPAAHGGSEAVGGDTAASEILKEIWVRGPQHAAFRRALKRRWSDRCAVHDAECNGQLRASHIVAWRLDESLRGDADNGLLLSVPLDSLFDKGWISFDDDGWMLVAKGLDSDTARHFGLTANLRLAWDSLSTDARTAICRNLQRHRDLYGSSREFVRV